MKQFATLIIISGLSSLLASATQTSNSLHVEMRHHLESFKDVVGGASGEDGRAVASEKINYADRSEALSFVAQHIHSEAQRAYLNGDFESSNGNIKNLKSESENIKKMMVSEFKYMLPLFEQELSLEASESNPYSDAAKVQYRNLLKDVLVEAAKADIEQAKAFMATRRLAEGAFAAQAEAEILQSACVDKKSCLIDSDEASDLSLASLEAQEASLDSFSLAQLENLPENREIARQLVTLDAYQAQALGVDRALSGQKDEH